jgi:hypothetical protein
MPVPLSVVHGNKQQQHARIKSCIIRGTIIGGEHDDCEHIGRESLLRQLSKN